MAKCSRRTRQKLDRKDIAPAKIEVLIFKLGGPVRRKTIFCAGADGVSSASRRVSAEACGAEGAGRRDREVRLAIGETARSVKQEVIPSIAQFSATARGRHRGFLHCSRRS